MAGGRCGAACMQEIAVVRGIAAAVEVADDQRSRLGGDTRGSVMQVGDAGLGENAADGRWWMQGIEDSAISSRGADVGDRRRRRCRSWRAARRSTGRGQTGWLPDAGSREGSACAGLASLGR